MKTVISPLIDEWLVAKVGDTSFDIVLSCDDAEGGKAKIGEDITRFCDGVDNAISQQELAKTLHLTMDDKKDIHATLMRDFDRLNRSKEDVLRVYLKTRRHKVVTDSQAFKSVKRKREADVRGTATNDVSEPKPKVSKKLATKDVTYVVANIIDRFEAIISEMAHEIRMLRRREETDDESCDHA